MNNTDQELRDKATQIIESVIDWTESGRTTVGRSNAIEPQVAVDILIKLITTNFIPLEEHNRKVAEARIDELMFLLNQFDLEGSKFSEILINDRLAQLKQQLTNKENKL